MCLIIYSPTASLPPRQYFAEAGVNNPDGIGVMSADGVCKFLGKRKTRRAWRYVQQLSDAGIPYGVHFRWATHGRVSRDNCHPFPIPGHDAHLMHNGILWTSIRADANTSDTAIFAREIAPAILSLSDRREYLNMLSDEASGNRLLIMRGTGGAGVAFDVINPALWTLMDGIYYSNLYSFDVPKKYRALTKAFQGPGSRYADYSPGGEVGSSFGSYGSSFDVSESEVESWLMANPDSWEAYDTEYCRAVAAGYTHDDAEDLATGVILRKMREAGTVDDSAYYAAKRNGFDWHDATTWDRYPIERVLNRHGDNEQPDTLDRPSVADMFI